MTTIKGKTMKTATIIAICALMACGNGPATWGEVSKEIAHAQCWREYACGTVDDIDECMEHEIYHLCGVDDTCGKEVFGSVDALTYQCTWAIHEIPCDVEFEWPEQCLHAFRHFKQPGRQH